MIGVGVNMKTFREIRNLQEAPLTSRFVAGDKLWKSTGGNGDYPDLGKVNYDPTKKFHSVGKPVVVHAMRDGFHEDFIFYSDGKYVLVVSGHKQVADARGSSDEAMMYMVDAGGGFTSAKLKAFAMKNAKAYMDRVLRVSDKVRDFSKEDEGSDTAPKSIKRMPFKESVEIYEFATSMTYFDKKGATKAEKIAKGLKIYKSTKEVGKAPNFAYTVHVDGPFDKIEKWSRLI